MFSLWAAIRHSDRAVWWSLDDPNLFPTGQSYQLTANEIKQSASWFSVENIACYHVRPAVNPQCEVHNVAYWMFDQVPVWRTRATSGGEDPEQTLWRELQSHIFTHTNPGYPLQLVDRWAILGGSVRVARADGTVIPLMVGNAHIEMLRQGSQIWRMDGTASIGTVCDNTRVRMMCGRSVIGSLQDMTHVELMMDSATVERMSGHARIGTMRGESLVSRISAQAAIGLVTQQARVTGLGRNAAISFSESPPSDDSIVAAPATRRILRLPVPPKPPPLTEEVFGAGICPCCTRPVGDLERRRRNTRYPETEDEANWLISCDECFAHDAEELESQWEEYRRGTL